jgi:type IV secretion system protein VirD4
VILIALAYLLYRILLRPIVRFFKRDRWEKAEEQDAKKWLTQLGSSHEQRMGAIADMFDVGTATLSSTASLRWKRREDQAEVGRREADLVGTPRRLRARKVDASMIFNVSRNLAGVDNRERTYLKVLEELNSIAEGEEKRFRIWRAALLWGDGKGVANAESRGLREGERENPVPVGIQHFHLSVDQVLNKVQQYASETLAQSDVDPRRSAILAKLSQAIAPAGGGGAWLGSSELGASPYAEQGSYALHIGSFADGRPLAYSGEGSMVTIAPPGSGKTQCNVIPNLLSWQGPAVVLDVSGELYEKSAGWRAANIGPVYKFNPLEPEQSHKYNPLTFVRSEPDYIWEDSRLLAEMMIVPSLTADPFWENEARTVLTAAIAHISYANPPEQRPMHAVLDILFGGEPWNQMIAGLRMAIKVRVMTQHATSLSSMNEKTLNSVLQTARASLSAWTGERVARATEHSDWSPDDLRDGSNPTVYICIRPNEVDSFLSLLRVFIGQHIRVLTGGAVPARDAAPILLMLDELPRLRYMAPIDEALSIGRKYGLRLWMFAQSVGQFKSAYDNADGLLGSCAVRVFMNPGGADGLAEQISAELGNVDSVNDNSRRRLVEAAELAGPEYRDLEIVLSTAGKPAKVRKDFAFDDAELVRRMKLPEPSLSGPPVAPGA